MPFVNIYLSKEEFLELERLRKSEGLERSSFIKSKIFNKQSAILDELRDIKAKLK
jgi:hypothetical protein